MRLNQGKKCIIAASIICVIVTIFGNTAYADVTSARGQEWSYTGFNEIRYFEEENLLRLQDRATDYSYFFIDLDGNLVENPQLNSQYLFNITSDDEYVDVYNALGVCLPRIYIDDPEWQEMIGGVSTAKGDLVWIKEIEPSLNETSVFVKAINVDNNETVYKIDCTSYVEPKYHIKISEYINYDDKPILIFNFFSIDLNTGEIIGGKEMDTDGTPRDTNGYRSSNEDSEGYRCIIDIYGQEITGDKKFGGLGRISEGLFFNKKDRSFYDVNLKKVIDLSEYPLYLRGSGYIHGWYNDAFYFEDGYCFLHAMNRDDIDFYSLINKNGDFVIDWTTEHFNYYGTVADRVLILGDWGIPNQFLYDLNTAEIEKIDWISGGIQVGNKVYYLKDYELYCFDCNAHESVKMEIKGLYKITD